MTSKLVEYNNVKPSFNFTVDPTVWLYYINCGISFCYSNIYLVGGVLVTSLLFYMVYRSNTTFEYENNINQGLQTLGSNVESSLSNTLNSSQISSDMLRGQSMSKDIIDGILFSCVNIIQAMVTHLHFEGGIEGNAFQQFMLRMKNVYKFCSKGRNLTDFLYGTEPKKTFEEHRRESFPDTGYILGHGEHHHPKCGLPEDAEDHMSNPD
jgi:hypothetical protein